ATSGGAEPPPHIGRHSRKPEFPHSLVPAPGSVFVDPQCRSPCLRAQVEVTIRSRFDILILAARHNFHRERATYGVPHKIRTGSG
ncbi:MAG TPA: hypothetical protein VF899_21015, partial [Pyrinomonadaceae bacterium]